MQTMKIWPSEIQIQVHRDGSGMRELGEKRHAFNQSFIQQTFDEMGRDRDKEPEGLN